MSVSAECPECGSAAPVPDTMVGRKVRCKGCQAVFVVKAANPKAKKRPATKPTISASGGVRRPEKKGSGLRVALALIVLLVTIGGIGAGAWYMSQEEEKPAPVKTAKSKGKIPTPEEMEKALKESKGKHSEDLDRAFDKAAKDAGLDKKTAKGKDGGKQQTKTPTEQPVAKKTTPEPVRKIPAGGEVKMIEPVVVAALAGSAPIDVKDIADVKKIIPIANVPGRVGVHVVEGKTNFFEMYDLKKQERLAKVKLDDGLSLMDVDPEGTILATSSVENNIHHINVYSLPEGTLVDDDWRPYNNIKDEARFLASGKLTQLAPLSKTQILILTSHGYGDIWEIRTHNLISLIPRPERRDFRAPDAIEPGRDFVLSPDRTMFAYAGDEGIQYFDSKTGKKIGATPKLTKYGTKPEIVGMGFDPAGSRLAVFLSAGKANNRPFHHVRFSVPGGEELISEAVEPGEFGGVEFVNGESFLAFKGRETLLRDGKGKTIATGRLPNGLFSPKVVRSNLAYLYVDAKSNKPTLGLANVPLGGAAAEAAPEPPPVKKDGANLTDIFAANPTPMPAVEANKNRTLDHQEIWEFGSQGILKKGVKTFEK